MESDKNIPSNLVVIYQGKQGDIALRSDIDAETVWVTQRQLAGVFDVDVRTVNEHIRNIFRADELTEVSVVRNFRITASDGKRYNTKHYNLDIAISVGYRVNFVKATKFRQWATATLKTHVTRGYTINERYLKQRSAVDLQRLSMIV